MIREEGGPRLRRGSSVASHVLGDRGLTDGDAQLLQLAMNARSTPERIRRRELTNQDTHLHRYTGTATAAALPGPEQAKAPLMPGDDRLRSDNVRADRLPCQVRESHAQRTRSVDVNRRSERRVRLTTAS